MNIIEVRPWKWLTREDARDTGTLIDKLFEVAFPHVARPAGEEAGENLITPRVDIAGADNEYRISVDLPGIEEKDIDVEVHGDALSITAKREHESKGENNDNKRYYTIERQYGMFRRTFQLPEDADAGNVTASYKNGVLHISVARKIPLKNEARKITIA